MLSHPVWVRGLKQRMFFCTPILLVSHPVWVRGLKRDIRSVKIRYRVAPRVGAWIETRISLAGILGVPWVAPRVGAWIETVPNWNSSTFTSFSRTPCGCVD